MIRLRTIAFSSPPLSECALFQELKGTRSIRSAVTSWAVVTRASGTEITFSFKNPSQPTSTQWREYQFERTLIAGLFN